VRVPGGAVRRTISITRSRVLDVATGPGLAAAAARVRGAMAIGVDVSPGMVALARRAHPGIEFQVAEVVALPFPDRSFDAVICNFGLGHFPEPEAALAECVRVLVPGGGAKSYFYKKGVRHGPYAGGRLLARRHRSALYTGTTEGCLDETLACFFTNETGEVATRGRMLHGITEGNRDVHQATR
jgi:ubiquinone/menaquinone biosynthesis C-methylase UbiE